MTTRQSAQKGAATRRRQRWYSERPERVEPEQDPAPTVSHAIAGTATVCGISLLGADSPDGVYVRPLVTCPDCLR